MELNVTYRQNQGICFLVEKYDSFFPYIITLKTLLRILLVCFLYFMILSDQLLIYVACTRCPPFASDLTKASETLAHWHKSWDGLGLFVFVEWIFYVCEVGLDARISVSFYLPRAHYGKNITIWFLRKKKKNGLLKFGIYTTQF